MCFSQNLLWKGGRGLPNITPAIVRVLGNCPPWNPQKSFIGTKNLCAMNIDKFLSSMDDDNTVGMPLTTFVSNLQQRGLSPKFREGGVSEAGRLTVFLNLVVGDSRQKKNLTVSEKSTPAALEAVAENRLGDFLRRCFITEAKNGGYFIFLSGGGEVVV